MKTNLCSILGLLCLLSACADDGSAAMDGGISGAGSGGAGNGGTGGNADRDGSVDEPLPPASGMTSSFDGTWVVTAEPAQLLRYPDSATAPADVIDLDWDAEYLEIVDGVAFYLGDSIVSGGEELHVQDLRTGERSNIAFSEESALAGLVFADGSLWVGDEALDVVWRVNPATKQVVGGTLLDNYDNDQNDGLELAASEDSVYVASFFGSSAVLRISTASGEVVARQEEGGDGTTGVAVGEGAAWATSRFDGSLWRYGAAGLELEQSIALEADISTMTRNVIAAFGSVWVLAGSGGNAQDIFGQEARPGIFRVDAATNAPAVHIPLEEPRGLRAGANALWASTAAAAVRIDPASSSITRTLTPPSGEVVDIAFARAGGGTGSTAGRTEIDVYSVVAPPPMVCEDLSAFYNHRTEPLLEAATASLTIEGAAGPSFDQGACHVLRNGEGQAVQYIAYFADDIEDPTKSAYVTIDGYAGDGTYSASWSWDGDNGGSGGGATAVVSEGGRHALVTSDFSGDTLELDCPEGADLALSGDPLPEPAPGEVVVQNEEGTVFRFINMDCGADILSEELTVTSPSYFIGPSDAYAFNLSTDAPAEEGTLAGSAWFSFYGQSFTLGEVEVVLSCGDPVTGTFSGGGYTGAFTCL